MAQHDYVINNQSAPAARADINAALLAIVTQNSGNTAPAQTYANMLWYESDTDTLWMRNDADSAWIAIGTFDQIAGQFNPSIQIATKAEAEAGTINTKMMTPLRTAQAITALVSAIDYQVFTASGTWNKPTNIPTNAMVLIEAWGGGGAGGDNNGSSSSSGGGGGGGEYMSRIMRATDVTSTVAVSVGSGGIAVDNGNGGDGGNSSFGSYVVASGGKGGTSGANSSDAVGGRGGAPYGPGTAPNTNGEFWSGGGGGDAWTDGGNAVFGGGGGGGSSNNATNGTGAAGGISINGGSGGGGIDNGTAIAGSVPGGGGGGSSGSAGIPANGARGEVRVWVIG